EFISPLTDITLVGWSSDGRFLTHQQAGATTGSDLWVLPLAGDRKPILVLRTTADEVGLRISPDGRYISYRSTDGVRSDVYVRPFDSANPGVLPSTEVWQVSTEPAGRAGVRWRADGKELYYISASGGVMAIEITTTPAFKAGTPKRLFQVPETYQLSPS